MQVASAGVSRVKAPEPELSIQSAPVSEASRFSETVDSLGMLECGLGDSVIVGTDGESVSLVSNGKLPVELASQTPSYYAARTIQLLKKAYVLPPEVMAKEKKRLRKTLRKAVPKGALPDAGAGPYRDLFAVHGTHLCTRVELGGSLQVVMRVDASADLALKDFAAQAEAVFEGLLAGGLNAAQQQTLKELVDQHGFVLRAFSMGGDPKLAAKITEQQLDGYLRWKASVRERPEVVKFAATGVWDLFATPSTRKRLRGAYAQFHAKVRYGDEVYIRFKDARKYLVGGLGGQQKEVEAKPWGEDITSADRGGYAWRIQRSPDEVGEGRVNFGDMMYLKVRNSRKRLFLSGGRGTGNALVVTLPLRSDYEKGLQGSYQWSMSKGLSEPGVGPLDFQSQFCMRASNYLDRQISSRRESNASKVATKHELDPDADAVYWSFEPAQR